MREHPPPRCERCGYDLSGLRPEQEPRCAECGAAQMMFNDQHITPVWRVLLTMIGPFVLAVLAIATIALILNAFGRVSFGAVACLFLPLVPVSMIAGPLSGVQMHAHTRRSDGVLRSPAAVRWLAWLALAIEVGVLIALPAIFSR